MQDPNNIIGRSLLDGISLINEALLELAHSLRDKPGVSGAKRGFDIRRYKTGPVLEAFVDVETRSGKAYSWWLDARWEQSVWTVESSVRMIHQKGQDLLVRFPVRESQAVSEFLEHLKSATDELIDSARKFNFSNDS